MMSVGERSGDGKSRLQRKKGEEVAALERVDLSGDGESQQEDVEELDNKKDYDIEYDKILGVAPVSSSADSPDDIEIVVVESFVSTQGWESETVVDYRINEEEFHKIRLFHCDFFIRNPPDPDDNVYDFREMYVTPPDTDVYSILKVFATMPQKYIRCAKSNFGSYNVTEPPIDAPRDPLYKTEREIMKGSDKVPFIQSRWLKLTGDEHERVIQPTSAEYDPSRGSEVKPELLTIGIMTPRYSKIEFPTYSGEGDPLSWVKRCENFFTNQRTTEADKVGLAAFHLVGEAQLWFDQIEQE
ncbi:PLASTID TRANSCRIPTIONALLY ACTIVE protein 6, chloroplastic-like [Zingiber officinale]|uniref:PLASTID TRANSCRIPTIONALLY ACTIVE protein 6, chloroplastic-like n=1 Tax=Zingiber officinale TaxID=94328 RepID=UPI001C4C7D16|nr:PLASTID TRANSCRIPTIONALLY ACTIVE protein 6, chloroplastic-like [Zingiber officinale]